MEVNKQSPFDSIEKSGKSISLYIHIPFCISKCSYCDFFSQECKNFSQNILDNYLKALKSQIEYIQNTCSSYIILKLF